MSDLKFKVANISSNYQGKYMGDPMHHYPGAKIIMAHRGGYFRHYLGRLDRNTGNRPAMVNNADGKKPREFLRAFYYDTCVDDPLVLKTLVERVGIYRLILGSDYPVGESDPVGVAELQAQTLPPSQAEMRHGCWACPGFVSGDNGSASRAQ